MADTTEVAVKARLSAKDEMRALLDRLPDDVTLEDIRYHIQVLEKIRRGIESLDRKGGVPHDEVVKRFEERWRTR